MCARVLSSRRGWGEGDPRHQHSPVTGCVPPPGIKDPTPHLPRVAPHSQVSAVYIHHEHCQYPRHSYHHQLELQGPQDPLHAQLDTGCLH